MKRVFVDTLFWVAITLPGDPWHTPALEAHHKLGDVHLITTVEVLTEFLTSLSAGGSYYRKQAAQAVRDILTDSSVTVLPQTHDSFLLGLDLYKQRTYKQYSLTDCISIVVLRAEGITEVLTGDHHFTQEGFTILIVR